MDHPKKRSWTRKLLPSFTSRPKLTQRIVSHTVPASQFLRCGVCLFELSEDATPPPYAAEYKSRDIRIDEDLLHEHRNSFDADLFRQSAALGCVTCAKFCNFFHKYLDIQDKHALGTQQLGGTMQWTVRSSRTLVWSSPVPSVNETDYSSNKSRYSTERYTMRLVRSGPLTSPHDN